MTVCGINSKQICMPLEVVKVLDAWRKGLAEQGSYHVDAQKRINEDKGLPFTEHDKRKELEVWVGRFEVCFTFSTGEWEVCDPYGCHEYLSYNPDKDEWHARDPYYGTITSETLTTEEAEYHAGMIWTG